MALRISASNVELSKDWSSNKSWR